MKERGMIFNGEMVRAILDGRKTQTRRPILWRQTPYTEVVMANDGMPWPWSEDCEHGGDTWHHCPFGNVGDRIWVRETWQGPLVEERAILVSRDPDEFKNPEFCEYAADGGGRPEFFVDDGDVHHGWRPSTQMPRWASRITLEITGVRVERLQDISQADAIAEGGPPDHPSFSKISREMGFSDWPRSWFAQTWWHIYGEKNWQANPWVWVIEFREAK